MRLDRITDGELSILQVLWERGEATSREITTALHEEVTDPKMASVQKLIERLEAKGASAATERTGASVPPAGQPRQFLRSRLQALADRLCNGALVPLVTTFCDPEAPARNASELRKLVDDLWPPKIAEDRPMQAFLEIVASNALVVALWRRAWPCWAASGRIPWACTFSGCWCC